MPHRLQENPSAMWEHLFERSVIGMALVAKDGTWLKANPKLQQLLGYTEYELQQMDFQVVTLPEDTEPDVESLKRLERGDIKSYTMKKRYITKDGDVIWVRLTVNPFTGPFCPDTEKADIIYYISQIEPLEEHEKRIEHLVESQTRLVNETLALVQKYEQLQNKPDKGILIFLNKHANWLAPIIVAIIIGCLLFWRDASIQAYQIKQSLKNDERIERLLNERDISSSTQIPTSDK